MAYGTLGQVAPVANTNTVVYTFPGNTVTTVNINVCNRGAVSGTIRIAISDTSTPEDKDYIEYDALVIAKGVLERTGIVVSGGKKIVVNCNSSTFSVNVYGFGE